MFHKQIIKDGDVTKVVKEILVDGQEYVDEKPREGSVNSITSGGVATALGEVVGGASDALQEQIDDIAEKAGSGYTPKGPASVAILNGLTGQENGWLYTMTDAGTLTDGSVAVVAGDTVAWDATNSVWYKAMDYATKAYATATKEIYQFAISGYTVATASVGVSLSVVYSKSNNWSCLVYPCKADDVFKITGQGGSSARLWCFVGTDGKVAAVSEENKIVSSEISVRAPADGTFIYNTTNSAVSKSCSVLSTLNNVAKEYEEALHLEDDVSLVDGVVSCAGSVGDTITITIASSSSWHCAVIPCKAGDVFNIAGWGGSSARLWCFVDASNKIQIVADENMHVETAIKIIAPADGTFIYNTSNSAPLMVCKRDSEIKNIVSEEKARTKSIAEAIALNAEKIKENSVYFDPLELMQKHYVDCDGSVGDTATLEVKEDTTRECIIIECEEGDEFKVAGSGGTKPRLWCFVDEEDKILLTAAAGSQITTPIVVKAPAAGKFIFNTTYSAAVIVCSKNVGLQTKVEELAAPEESFLTPKMAEIGLDLNVVDVSSEYEGFSISDGSPNTTMSQVYAYLDEVMENSNGLMTKVDAAEEMGLEYPAYASDYKTYMYKVSNTNEYAGNGAGGVFEKKKIFIMAGVHGLEIAAVFNLAVFLKRICQNITDDDNLFKVLSAFDIYAVPCVNGYGLNHYTYRNGNDVNINRNFPTIGWTASADPYGGPYAASEFETQLIIALIDSIHPDLAIDHHAFYNGARQWYDSSSAAAIMPILYQLLTESSLAFKKGFPEYFGTQYSLLKDMAGDAPSVVGNTQGIFSNWINEHGTLGLTVEMSKNINYLDGESETTEKGLYGPVVFSCGEFILRSHFCRLGDYVLKNIIE